MLLTDNNNNTLDRETGIFTTSDKQYKLELSGYPSRFEKSSIGVNVFYSTHVDYFKFGDPIEVIPNIVYDDNEILATKKGNDLIVEIPGYSKTFENFFTECKFLISIKCNDDYYDAIFNYGSGKLSFDEIDMEFIFIDHNLNLHQIGEFEELEVGDFKIFKTHYNVPDDYDIIIVANEHEYRDFWKHYDCLFGELCKLDINNIVFKNEIIEIYTDSNNHYIDTTDVETDLLGLPDEPY